MVTKHPNRLCLLLPLLLLPCVSAIVSIYQTPQQSQLSVAAAAASSAATAPAGTYTGLPAYNTTLLVAPQPPQAGDFPTQITLQLTDAPMLNVSIPQKSSFFGFSIEMSVVNQVCELSPLVLLSSANTYWASFF